MQANAALDELIQHAEDNARLIQAARAGGSKLAPAERKRATDLLHSIAVSLDLPRRMGRSYRGGELRVSAARPGPPLPQGGRLALTTCSVLCACRYGLAYRVWVATPCAPCSNGDGDVGAAAAPNFPAPPSS